jgi:hypothetical protein
LTKPLLYVIIITESEVIEMANKKNKKVDRRAFKKTGEELQQWLIFTRRGSRVESGKKYNRQKFKRGDRE